MDYEKAVRGNSNKCYILKRASGRCKLVYEPYESILEQGMERL
jgi:hypothetical protein